MKKDLKILFNDIFKKTKQRKYLIYLIIIIIFVNFYSLSTLTTKPKVWYDEGINIELARNFSDFGELDLIVEPLVFSGRGANVGSTGYTVTMPLALFFKIFGFGFEQARIYMLFWMTLFIICLYYFVKKKWGGKTAIITTLLITTFAPFYGNGRCVMGEIPGFTFIILAFISYIYKRNFFLTGILIGLAVISKPSVFIFFIPAFAAVFLIERRSFFKRIFKFGLGSIIPLIVWFLVYLEAALSISTWQRLKMHFINPYKEEGFTSLGNIKNNLVSFFESTTLIYFLLLTLAIILAIYFNREFYKKNKSLLLIFLIYSLFAFFYYLKSLGHLRYLIAYQFLVFIIFVPSIIILISRFLSPRYIRYAIFSIFYFLILLQTIHLFTKAELFYSAKAQRTFTYVQENFREENIGVINVPSVASLIPAERKFQMLSTYGMGTIGKNPLSYREERLPGVIIFHKDHPIKGDNEKLLNKYYEVDKEIDAIMIYRKRN